MLADGLDNLVVPDRQVEPITEEPFTGSDEEARSAQRSRPPGCAVLPSDSQPPKLISIRASQTYGDSPPAPSLSRRILAEPIMVGEIADVNDGPPS